MSYTRSANPFLGEPQQLHNQPWEHEMRGSGVTKATLANKVSWCKSRSVNKAANCWRTKSDFAFEHCLRFMKILKKKWLHLKVSFSQSWFSEQNSSRRGKLNYSGCVVKPLKMVLMLWKGTLNIDSPQLQFLSVGCIPTKVPSVLLILILIFSMSCDFS